MLLAGKKTVQTAQSGINYAWDSVLDTVFDSEWRVFILLDAVKQSPKPIGRVYQDGKKFYAQSIYIDGEYRFKNENAAISWVIEQCDIQTLAYHARTA